MPIVNRPGHPDHGKTARQILEEEGFPLAPPDHPIYSEGASITFLSRPPKSLKADDRKPKKDR